MKRGPRKNLDACSDRSKSRERLHQPGRDAAGLSPPHRTVLGVLRVLGEQARAELRSRLTTVRRSRQAYATSARWRPGMSRTKNSRCSLGCVSNRMRRSPRRWPSWSALKKTSSTVEAWHQELDTLGSRWLKENNLDAASISRFRQLTRQLSELYEKHIQVEDSELFPLAASNLARSELSEIGREMAERRGARVPAALNSQQV